jgi:glycosyltransferase involved in cell wall biosynthesis
MPLTVLEAMAAGLPIVGSDVIGIRELVKGVGVLVENPSPETFAKALTELHDKPESLQELSVLSRETAEQYSWDKLVKRLEYIYDELIR